MKQPRANENPARVGDAAELGICSLRGCENRPDTNQTAQSPQERNVADAKRDLLRSFTAEALRIAAMKAAHAADDVEIGDDDGAERSIRIAIGHLKEGAAAFRKMQAALDASAAEILAGAVAA
jgi:hypothetical protein